MKKRVVFVLDNARIHKRKEVEDIAKEFHTCFIFLPPYSPDLNMVELVIGMLKSEY